MKTKIGAKWRSWDAESGSIFSFLKKIHSFDEKIKNWKTYFEISKKLKNITFYLTVFDEKTCGNYFSDHPKNL